MILNQGVDINVDNVVACLEDYCVNMTFLCTGRPTSHVTGFLVVCFLVCLQLTAQRVGPGLESQVVPGHREWLAGQGPS